MNLVEAGGAFLLSTVKLMVAPIGFTTANVFPLIEIAIICGLGGMTSAVVFFFVGKQIAVLRNKRVAKSTTKKIFTKKNIQIIKIKNKFGLYGMAMLIGLISVPLGALLVGRYFGKNKMAIPALIAAAYIWSFGMTYSTAVIVRMFLPYFS